MFERTPELGGATGGAYTNPLLGIGMEPAAVLMREAIQNSADANVDGKVRVEFRKVALAGKQKAEFIAAIGIRPAILSRQKKLKLPRGNCLDSVDDGKEALNLLYIEDYETHGLFGNPSKSKSHFFRLLLSIGDDAKSNDSEGSGGSYGFGKSVYSSNSRIHTIVAYSVFDPKDSGVDAKNHARLMGCSYFNQHEFLEEEFSGRAWFGYSKSQGTAAEPLVDSDAHAFAARLGFTPRGKQQRGTSILVIDCDVESDQLRESIEEWWWPRLLEDQLDVALFEQGHPLPPPRPRKRSDLRPFIECFEMAIGRSESVGDHQKTGELKPVGDKPLGNYGYTSVNDEVAGDDKFVQERNGRVALIRAHRMVIEYMPIGGNLPLACVGTFVAAPEIDKYLKRSEPAPHNKWDEKSSRLSELAPEARESVQAVVQRLKNGLRAFAREAAPQAPKQDLRLKSLEKLLGGLFKSPTVTPGGPKGSTADPIAIKFVEEPRIVAKQAAIATKGSFRVSLADHASRDQVKVSVRVSCLVQEDDGLSREDPIPVTLKSDEVNGEAGKGPEGAIIFKLRRDENPLFVFKSDAYSADWTTHVQVHVEEV